MDRFTNLTRLKIIAQDISEISGLGTSVQLEELWICECKLTVSLVSHLDIKVFFYYIYIPIFSKRIEGLTACKKLKSLLLYSNKIVKMENLAHLNLAKLWLNNNKIAKIEGIQHMSELKDLNVARNCISTIGESLTGLNKLETLNLAGNQIENFQVGGNKSSTQIT